MQRESALMADKNRVGEGGGDTAGANHDREPISGTRFCLEGQLARDGHRRHTELLAVSDPDHLLSGRLGDHSSQREAAAR
jgi:hypothetical protein